MSDLIQIGPGPDDYGTRCMICGTAKAGGSECPACNPSLPVCPHGQLARSCPICERDETIKGLRESLEAINVICTKADSISGADPLEISNLCHTALSGGTP